MILNSQPIEKRLPAADVIQVHSIFYTIQGEGPFAGAPSVFVRLAGCNLQCPWCDTDYTSSRESLTPWEVVRRVFRAVPPTARDKRLLVVITGGEPFRQDLTNLFVALLQEPGVYIQVETNGTLPPPKTGWRIGFEYSFNTNARKGVYVVVSPKTGKVQSAIWAVACAAKYVLDSDHIEPDGLPSRALGLGGQHPPARVPAWVNVPVYLQPMDEKSAYRNSLHLQAAMASCLANGYILQLQLHKIIEVE